MTPEEEVDHALAISLNKQLNVFDIPEDSPAVDPTSPASLGDTSDDADLARALALKWEQEISNGEATVYSTEWEDEDLIDEPSSSKSMFHWPSKPVRTAQPLQRNIFPELSRKRDSDVEELCKADGVFYARGVSNAGAEESFGSLNEFMAHVRDAKCTMCNAEYSVTPASISAWFTNWSGGSIAPLSSQTTCPNCGMVACLFCAQRVPKESSWVKIHGKEVSWCCASGRLLLIWILLCAFDDRFYPTDKPLATPQKPDNESAVNLTFDEIGTVKKQKAEPNMPRKKGVGFGGPSIHNLSFAPFDGHRERSPGNDSGLIRAQQAQMDEDTLGSMFLRLLATLLPVLTRETTFDRDPPEAVAAMLLESKILEYSAALLRNDSLDDVSVRQLVYRDLFTFVTLLCEHHATSELVHKDRLVRSDGRNLSSRFSQGLYSVPEDKRESLSNSLRNLATQSGLLVQRAHATDFTTQDDQGLMRMARHTAELWNFLSNNSPEHFGLYKLPNGAALNANPDPISHLSDDQIMASHHFARQAQGIQYTPHGRMRKIITHIANLSTGLPQGIHVRYSIDRPDVMKAIIIGPAGTPYEGGIFEFDIFCPANYPNEPPRVKFRTTGNGTVDFNPNLYSDGKVCLSLLGTWRGPSWDPNHSTLLQVLVSIQAMILCEDPWYNEPARDRKDSASSAAYNKTIRALTVEHAILGYADCQGPIWADVIEQHFKHNADKILQTMQAWTELEVERQPRQKHTQWRHSRSKPLVSMQKQLQNAMRKFGSTLELGIMYPPQESKQPPSQVLGAPFGPSISPANLLDKLQATQSDRAGNYDPPSSSFGRGGNNSSTGRWGLFGSWKRGGVRGGFLPSNVDHFSPFLSTLDGSAEPTPAPRGRGQIARGPYPGVSFPTRGGRGSGPALAPAGSSPVVSRNSDLPAFRGRGVPRRGGFKYRGGISRGGRGSGPAPDVAGSSPVLPNSDSTRERGQGQGRGRGRGRGVSRADESHYRGGS
ncbi:hypothetical protein PMIN03_012613 [Paraphaeosphaeria minitans]